MEKASVIAWVRKHKALFLVMGVSVAVLLMIIQRCRRKGDLAEFVALLEYKLNKTALDASTQPPIDVPTISVIPSDTPLVRSYTPYSAAFTVSSHYRNLPVGKHSSKEKIAEALEAGIVLPQNQTLVNSYQKGIAD